MSGASADRALPVTPSGCIFPAFTCGSPCPSGPQKMPTSPDTAATIAGAAPLYGTCVMSIPAALLSISPHRCPGEAGPADENVILPGLAFAADTNSASVFTLSDGCATSMFMVSPNAAIGSRSLRESYGVLMRFGAITIGRSTVTSNV